ncbi:MAG: ethanolamine ammonia-lyase subunit EutB [Bacteroidales bacterium]|jgi:ethanolamine ammonia-lyase large subunit
MSINRRFFLKAMAAGAATIAAPAFVNGQQVAPMPFLPGVTIDNINPGEDVFAYILRKKGTFDDHLYRQILGAANAFKEGDEIIGVAAAEEGSRTRARILMSNTRIGDLSAHPLLDDDLGKLVRESLDAEAVKLTDGMTLGELKQVLLTQPESVIYSMAVGLHSEVIGCVVKLMSNDELIHTGSKIFNPLPGSHIGDRGYLGARIQPNSPTDDVDDIRWQVFDGWSYAVGDVVVGTNPVSSDTSSILAIENILKDLLVTFGIEDTLPHSVLAHIDLQAEVEQASPGSTALWFQSIAGSDSANNTFDISIEKMRRHTSQRSGQYGLYFETGQGADFTNGHSHGFDMVIHESRKYGFARALTLDVAAAQKKAGRAVAPWVHLNDVAGFIGPEVFRNREQLVRCCLEDIVMGKLHGLTIGLDVCSTLHMDVTLNDLDWCIDQVIPACPAYLMALPTKIDPMLGYLTTGFQDHVRVRQKFGLKVNDRMGQFFRELGVVDGSDKPAGHFGDPLWVNLQYRRKKGDTRTDEEILAEGRSQIESVRKHGVFVASGHGDNPWDLEPELAKSIQLIYTDARKCIWAELSKEFIRAIPDGLRLSTQSTDRTDYILHPQTGEMLTPDSVDKLVKLRQLYNGNYNVQVVVSDGLDALSITDDGHLNPFLLELRQKLGKDGFHLAPSPLVMTSGRVRAGYRIGETLFANLPGNRAILHVIGERPGTGHHTFSVYITSPAGAYWGQSGKVDHNITKVVSGIAATALLPLEGALQTARILKTMVQLS